MSFPIPTPNVLDRSKGFMILQYINDPNILGYRVRVANSLNEAYGPFNGLPLALTGTTALFDVDRDRTFISKAIRFRRTGISGDITRGQTRAIFDPNEYFGLSAQVPPDSGLWFVRTQIRTVASPAFPIGADNTNQSIILIVQDPEFFSVPRPALTLHGRAPNLAGATPGLPAPPQAMVFGVPAFADAMVITNHDAVFPLFFAAALDQPLIQVDPLTSISHASGMKDEMVICSTGGNPDFSMLVSTVTGMR
jgi:hypothetical protein